MINGNYGSSMSVDHSEGANLSSDPPWTITISNALAGFGGIIGYFSGNQILMAAQLVGSPSIGHASGNYGTACVGGLVGYMIEGTCMDSNTSSSMSSVSINGSYFAGAVVGFSGATRAAATTIYYGFYDESTNTFHVIGSKTIVANNVQASYNQKVTLNIHNSTYNGGSGYNGSSNWRDMGGGGYKDNWVTNGPRVGRMVDGSTYHVTDPDGTLSG